MYPVIFQHIVVQARTELKKKTQCINKVAIIIYSSSDTIQQWVMGEGQLTLGESKVQLAVYHRAGIKRDQLHRDSNRQFKIRE